MAVLVAGMRLYGHDQLSNLYLSSQTHLTKTKLSERNAFVFKDHFKRFKTLPFHLHSVQRPSSEDQCITKRRGKKERWRNDIAEGAV